MAGGVPDSSNPVALIVTAAYTLAVFVLTSYLHYRGERYLGPRWDRVRLRTKGAWQKLTRHQSARPPQPKGVFIGNLDAGYTLIDGSGDSEYRPENLRFIYESTRPIEDDMPDELKQRRIAIANEQERKREAGEKYHWDGPLIALASFSAGRTPIAEDLELTLSVRPAGYFSFLATVADLDTPFGVENKSVRDRYTSKMEDVTSPVPWLATGLAVAVVVKTKDDQLVLARRSQAVGARKGEYDVSLAEGVHASKDNKDVDGRAGFDLFQTAIRGVAEELGVVIEPSKLHLLAFGVDWEFYQWGILGVAETDMDSRQLLQIRTRRARDALLETSSLEFFPARDPNRVLEAVKGKMWPTGLVALYLALQWYNGRERVEAAADQVYPASP